MPAHTQLPMRQDNVRLTRLLRECERLGLPLRALGRSVCGPRFNTDAHALKERISPVIAFVAQWRPKSEGAV